MLKAREVSAKEAHFEVYVYPEEMDFQGNVSAVDDDTDAEQEAWVREQLENGNTYAWCYVVVTARWEGFEGSACLGGCSYASWRDIETDLLPDMREEALATLNEEIAGAVAKLARAL